MYFRFRDVSFSYFFGQENNLQFNQVINQDFTVTAATGWAESWLSSGTITVPSNTVWKITSSSAFCSAGSSGYNFNNKNARDELYDEAVALVVRERRASTSFIQRHLKIGYNRAATIIEKMEDNNIVSKPGRAGKREILIEDN